MDVVIMIMMHTIDEEDVRGVKGRERGEKLSTLGALL